MQWAPEVELESVVLTRLDLAGVEAPGSRFLDCRWESSTLTGGNLDRTTWRGTTLRGLRMVGVGLARSTWTDVTLEGCALHGCEVYGARLRRVAVRDGVVDSVNLREAVVEEVTFDGCLLRDVDLGGARLRAVRFPGCRIERLDLTKATLDDVDLRGAKVSIAHGLDRLRGAVVDHAQLLDLAPSLAVHLGLEVRAVGEDGG